MLLNILLSLHILICIALIGTVLVQQSEGGALGMGGGPSGFMTARGAGNFLTRLTWILFSAFLVLSVLLTVVAGQQRAANSLTGSKIEKVDPNSLRPLPQPTAPTTAPLPTAPLPEATFPAAPAAGEPAAK